MEFFMKLPRNKKEFALFLVIVAMISVNIIAPLITCFEVGFHLYAYLDVLTVMPLIFLAVIGVVLVTYVPAEKLTTKIASKGDSFNSYIIVNILCSVVMISFFMTVIGTWIGTRSITLDPIQKFFFKWPRNFALALFVESCIAQPIARKILFHLHVWQDNRKPAEQ